LQGQQGLLIEGVLEEGNLIPSHPNQGWKDALCLLGEKLLQYPAEGIRIKITLGHLQLGGVALDVLLGICLQWTDKKQFSFRSIAPHPIVEGWNFSYTGHTTNEEEAQDIRGRLLATVKTDTF